MTLRFLSRSFFVLVLATVGLESSAQEYRVGAYYFGKWTPFVSSLPSSCSRPTTGIPFWWCGNREFFLGEPDYIPAEWQGRDYTYLKPAIGWYDCSSVSDVTLHIRQARANGLYFFNNYWYWRHTLEAGTGGEILHECLTAFLQAPNSEDMKFAISIVTDPRYDEIVQGPRFMIEHDQFDKAIDTIVTKYLSQPHYLRNDDDEPVVFVLLPWAIGDEFPTDKDEDVASFLDLLRQETIARLGVAPFIVMNTEVDDSANLNLRGATLAPFLDGYTCHAGLYFGHLTRVARKEDTDPPNLYYREYSLDSVGYNLPRYLQGWTDRPVIPCAPTDFDEKPRAAIEKLQDKDVPTSVFRHVVDWSPANLTAVLSSLKNFSDNHYGDAVDNMVNLYAWNEWREAGYGLEPSEGRGNETIAQVSTAFGLPTRGDQNCKINGDCTYNEHLPAGTLDHADCSNLAGWARDADTTVALDVHIYLNGGYPYGQHVATVKASALRTDLYSVFDDAHHGFSITTPIQAKTGQPVTIWAHAINVNGNGEPSGQHPLLSGSGMTITCSP